MVLPTDICLGSLSQAEDHRLSGSSMYQSTQEPSKRKSELGRKKQQWRSLSCLALLQHRHRTPGRWLVGHTHL